MRGRDPARGGRRQLYSSPQKSVSAAAVGDRVGEVARAEEGKAEKGKGKKSGASE